MNSKPHRQNSTFQLRHFLAGSCHTADAAWALMYSQRIDIEGKLRHAESQKLRRESKIQAAEENLAWYKFWVSKSKKLEALADKVEALADVPVWDMNVKGAQEELDAICQIMHELEPLRKYKDLDVLEASEACQREEWCLELMNRAETFMVSQGSIPADQLSTMRTHPDFEAKLIPHIAVVHEKMQRLGTMSDGLRLLATVPAHQIETNVTPIKKQA